MFIVVGEVPRPDYATAAVTRRPDYTVVTVHPGSPVPDAAQDINALLDDDEFATWAPPYLGPDPIVLARLRATPTYQIPDWIMRTPILAPYILPTLRAPWVNYN